MHVLKLKLVVRVEVKKHPKHLQISSKKKRKKQRKKAINLKSKRQMIKLKPEQPSLISKHELIKTHSFFFAAGHKNNYIRRTLAPHFMKKPQNYHCTTFKVRGVVRWSHTYKHDRQAEKSCAEHWCVEITTTLKIHFSPVGHGFTQIIW